MAEMDIARKTELALLDYQKPMNAVIDRGDSTVQQFYRDAVVFITGGSGFLGKQLIEKLFRSCDIKKIYLLMRAKKGYTGEQRLQKILKDPLYDTLRKKKPNFAEKLAIIGGDIADLRVGLSKKDWTKITNEVNVIIHLAATVNFEEPIRRAAFINIRGTREMLQLARECTNLKLFSHISTAYAHATTGRINTEVKEKFYPCPLSPETLLDLVESVDEERLNNMTPALIKDWPNTYTFTKALTEELIRTTASDLPICIVKPPIVLSAFTEPSPGWIDIQTVLSSSVGFLLGAGLGVMHVSLVRKETIISIVPVDFVNNAIIAAGCDAVINRNLLEDNIPIYTVSSSSCGIRWGYLLEVMRSEELLNYASPKALWYCAIVQTSNKKIYLFLAWLLHFIPAYIIDGLMTVLGVRPKKMPSLVKLCTKVTKLSYVYNYFFNDWIFKDDNLLAMTQRMSPADKAIFNCNVRQISGLDLMKSMTIGLRRFIVKDGLEGSAYGRRKQLWLRYANMILVAAYFYLIWKFIYFVYSIFAMLIPI